MILKVTAREKSFVFWLMLKCSSQVRSRSPGPLQAWQGSQYFQGSPAVSQETLALSWIGSRRARLNLSTLTWDVSIPQHAPVTIAQVKNKLSVLRCYKQNVSKSRAWIIHLWTQFINIFDKIWKHISYYTFNTLVRLHMILDFYNNILWKYLIF